MAATEMNFCAECGARLERRKNHEGHEVPFCPACGRSRYPGFDVAVIMVVADPARERVLLIRQYGRERNILVAGYVDQGESAEAAVRREIREELGVETAALRYNRSEYLSRSNTLMLNYVVIASSDAVRPNDEIDAWAWYSPEEAREAIFHGSLAEKFLLEYLDAAQ